MRTFKNRDEPLFSDKEVEEILVSFSKGTPSAAADFVIRAWWSYHKFDFMKKFKIFFIKDRT